MVAVASSIALPKELVEEIEAAAAEFDLPREVVVRAAVRQFVRAERQWRETAEDGARVLAAHGIRPEDVEVFVEEFMDSLEDEGLPINSPREVAETVSV